MIAIDTFTLAPSPHTSLLTFVAMHSIRLTSPSMHKNYAETQTNTHGYTHTRTVGHAQIYTHGHAQIYTRTNTGRQRYIAFIANFLIKLKAKLSMVGTDNFTSSESRVLILTKKYQLLDLNRL